MIGGLNEKHNKKQREKEKVEMKKETCGDTEKRSEEKEE
jgi:hypothetical protein